MNVADVNYLVQHFGIIIHGSGLLVVVIQLQTKSYQPEATASKCAKQIVRYHLNWITQKHHDDSVL